MILQTADGTKYKATFRHWVPCKPVKVKGLGTCRGEVITWPNTKANLSAQEIFSKGPKTVVLIFKDGEELPIAREVARLKPGDTFTKKMGRRIALGRALQTLVITQVLTPFQALQLMTCYRLRIGPQCQHRLKDGREAWLLYHENKVCLLCHKVKKLA